MPIDFERLLDDDDLSVIAPHDIFITLNYNEKFQFLRGIQTEVMKDWFEQREQRDTVIKLNVGSGKTLVGLLLLQSSLNEKVFPAVYIVPNKQLVEQVIAEAGALGIDVTDSETDVKFSSGESILVTTIHKLFNGKSVFGVGQDGVKIELGAIVIDDAHACVAIIKKQFRIILPNTHTAYQKILKVIEEDLKQQSLSRFQSVESGDPQHMMEVPYWTWIDKQEKIVQILHNHKIDDELKFAYPLLQDILSLCRCIISGEKLEIEPDCPPTDLIQAFSHAKRRIYMTATLADDSVLVTHFGANPNNLRDPIVPTSSQSMGERMILMPEEINPAITPEEIKNLLVKLAQRENVVVIVPSENASEKWKDVAAQTLMASDIVEGVNKLRKERVGLTVLVNRYDGIDLPDDACRILVIDGLPEVASFSDRRDAVVLSNSQISLRRQMQRIEQGMGRGIRSNNDYCVVLLVGPKLVQRARSSYGIDLLTPATKTQLDFSRKIAKDLKGTDINGIAEVIDICLKRESSWVQTSKKVLLKAQTEKCLTLDKASVAMRSAFDAARLKDYRSATSILNAAVNDAQDDREKAWLMSKLATMQHHLNPTESQKKLLAARRLNLNILSPIEGIPYKNLASQNSAQAEKVQSYHQERFLEATDRMLAIKDLVGDLYFQKIKPDKFEAAIDEVARFIGLGSQRPDKQFKEGPDNLWGLPDGSFLIIECKNNVSSENGISKAALGQLEQSMSWFEGKYMNNMVGTPVIIHPFRTLGEGASEIEGMRIMTKTEIGNLREALTNFAKQLSEPNILNDRQQINDLLAIHGFNGGEFLNRHTATTLK